MSKEHVVDNRALGAGEASRGTGSSSSRALCSEDGWLREFRFSPQDVPLTAMQQIICQCIACGLSDKETAYFLGIEIATVKAHNAKILRALGLIRRAQMVRLVFESGSFDPEMVEREVRRRNMLGHRRKRKGGHT